MDRTSQTNTFLQIGWVAFKLEVEIEAVVSLQREGSFEHINSEVSTLQLYKWGIKYVNQTESWLVDWISSDHTQSQQLSSYSSEERMMSLLAYDYEPVNQLLATKLQAFIVSGQRVDLRSDYRISRSTQLKALIWSQSLLFKWLLLSNTRPRCWPQEI